jgi:RimJ/RimL family protein N-acetyltransferase
MIETTRLRCEPVTASHAEVMFPLLSDARIYVHLPDQPPTSVEALRARYAFLSTGTSPDGLEHWLNWMLFLRETGEPIGFCQATVRAADISVAYVLAPAAWGKGYAAEATSAVVTYLFGRYEVHRVKAEIHVDNHASIALVKRLGFSFVRHDSDENDDVYEITRSAWSELRNES